MTSSKYVRLHRHLALGYSVHGSVQVRRARVVMAPAQPDEAEAMLQVRVSSRFNQQGHKSLARLISLIAWTVGVVVMLSGLAASANAQVGPDGYDWVTVGSPGNAGYDGPDPTGQYRGAGRVDYEYRIGRFEVTTSQWTEFMNAALDRPANDAIPFVDYPLVWGASGTTPNNPDGLRWRVPAGREMRPVGGVSWRTCAILCNWLENGKATNREAFLNGVYDVSTFGSNPDGSITDQLAHTPGSNYWIPTLSEWVKAAHFDPNRYGQGQGGYWLRPHGSDEPLIYGPPGQGQANSGFRLDLFGELRIPLGAYPDVRSPWGLLDVAGATTEWTETIWRTQSGLPSLRMIDGSYYATFSPGMDTVAGGGASHPSDFFSEFGLRLASSVPSPSAVVLGSLGFCVAINRRRRV